MRTIRRALSYLISSFTASLALIIMLSSSRVVAGKKNFRLEKKAEADEI